MPDVLSPSSPEGGAAAGHQLGGIDALNLIFPLSLTPIKEIDMGDGPEKIGGGASKNAPRLSGYAALEQMRNAAAEFRAGYKNWRAHGAKGARGESKDVFKKKPEVRASNLDQSTHNLVALLEKAQEKEKEKGLLPPPECEMSSPILQAHRRSHRAETLGNRELSGEDALGVKTPDSDRRRSSLSRLDSRSHSQTDLGALAAGESKPVDPVESSWLRFFFNPHTPLDREAVKKFKAEQAAKEKAEGKHLEPKEVEEDLEPSFYPLNLANLPKIRQSKDIKVGQYDRSREVDSWILHIGVGGFHRSHQAVYLDELLAAQQRQQAGNPDAPLPPRWAICGVGLMPFDKKMYDVLKSQDYMYTVWTRAADVSEPRVVQSIMGFLFVPESLEETDLKALGTAVGGGKAPAWLARLLDPKTKIVSLTVTEKGYYQNTDGDLDRNNPNIVHDKNNHMTAPKTVLGFIFAGLKARMQRGMPPFTVLSCDNLPDNGHVIQKMVKQFTVFVEGSEDGEVSRWIAKYVQFPCTMVDRITPVTQPEHIELLKVDFRIQDGWPVVAESFKQWVIEDKFAVHPDFAQHPAASKQVLPGGFLGTRPNWESSGALVVSDVTSYELMKLRLLNGGHSMMSYVSYLAGYEFVDDGVNDVSVSCFLRAYMDEVTPTITGLGLMVELERYKEKVVERFGNRLIKDSVSRITEDGSTKFFNTTRDSLCELLRTGGHCHEIALGIAAYLRYMTGKDEEGNPIRIKDPKAGILTPLAIEATNKAESTELTAKFIREVYGDIGNDIKFVNQVNIALNALNIYGADYVLRSGGALQALLQATMGMPDGAQRLLKFTAASSSAS
uniref:Mannitol dehydrogenase C-terminal domain-containing protein n=1 Tax=Chromera velia CCMP2878 TaxID=1169474 RepID=A0A0G4FUV3_9ALVE|mmetsp:Transcript_42564/g.83912  ORF Transcript_42564/g.83912 Transcript_42564/m.83912 type:complete len:839 (+) Transcript_42564:288-2804(+)|eukprot:Cvel_18886.t1-p1 / transcript=Cvel_18886.t1 / gene=Cvel_18886 / organism=Chromera_velia_CCMP2878 / gene_product=Mannitol 2-dehydrogenase, putative / transcript_product=Mannitol 2-dehydrogenase, putative / location=Cvel_scaffold1591:976-8064(+) / protein_length=838 / sequence_SO=supercontig / SO=protein_coding / is_pseudo=false